MSSEYLRVLTYQKITEQSFTHFDVNKQGKTNQGYVIELLIWFLETYTYGLLVTSWKYIESIWVWYWIFKINKIDVLISFFFKKNKNLFYVELASHVTEEFFRMPDAGFKFVREGDRFVTHLLWVVDIVNAIE